MSRCRHHLPETAFSASVFFSPAAAVVAVAAAGAGEALPPVLVVEASFFSGRPNLAARFASTSFDIPRGVEESMPDFFG